MWCPQCQADVATEVAGDGQSLLCTGCGGEVRKVFAPSLHPETRSARELLQRWAAEEMFDPAADEAAAAPGPPSASSSQGSAPMDEAPSPAVAPEEEPPRAAKLRVDGAHPTYEIMGRRRNPRKTPPQRHGARPEAAPSVGGREHETQALPEGYRQDPAQASVRAPHFEVQAAVENPERSGRSESLWGQLLAYAGVGVLTIGTVLVLWGHFGHVDNYTSTGWLVATGGQMLLFLGVVTLVSGGMQQTTHEVTRRVERIGERMIRIEQSTRDLLQGPHFQRTHERRETSAAEADEPDARSA